MGMRVCRRVGGEEVMLSARSLFDEEEALEAATPFEVHDKVRKPEHLPNLEDLFALPAEEYNVDVPKTNGELRVHIRHDDEGDHHGSFVHGFRPGSLAESILKVGDELLEVNGTSVKSKYLEDVVNALQGHGGDSVRMRVCRRVGGEEVMLSARSLFDEEEALEAATPFEVHDKVRKPEHLP